MKDKHQSYAIYDRYNNVYFGTPTQLSKQTGLHYELIRRLAIGWHQQVQYYQTSPHPTFNFYHKDGYRLIKATIFEVLTYSGLPHTKLNVSQMRRLSDGRLTTFNGWYTDVLQLPPTAQPNVQLTEDLRYIGYIPKLKRQTKAYDTPAEAYQRMAETISHKVTIQTKPKRTKVRK